MAETANSTLPWRFERDYDESDIFSADGLFLASLYGDEGDKNAANAAFICRAVNAHDDLVAELKEARDYISRSSPDWHVAKIEQMARIDAALAKSGAA